jgi:hypothetical protein
MSGERLDLDAVQARYDGGRLSSDPAICFAAIEDVPDLVAELRVAYAFRDEVHSALQPGRWRGFDGPDGVSTHEVIADVAAALERFDQHTQPPTQDEGS